MIRTVKNSWFWSAGICFTALIVLFLYWNAAMYVPVMTLVSVLSLGVIFFAGGIRIAFFISILSLPLSVNVNVTGTSQLMFPSELLAASLALSVVLHWVRNPGEFVAFLKNPVTIAFTGYAFFMVISVFTSELFTVSLKSVFIKLIYLLAFYGGAFILFRKYFKETAFSVYYIFPLSIVVIFIMIHHASFEFSKDASGFVTKPFFQDHTIYSAALAFMLPLAFYNSRKFIGWNRTVYFFVFLLFAVAIYVAGSRAAWLSVVLSLCLVILLVFRMHPGIIGSGFLIMIALLYVYNDDVLFMMKANRNDSNARFAGIEEQTKSLTNITNDQSNAERINRWKCAWRMFNTKPLTGFGPGTYQFMYFPIQREKDMTRISVTSPYNIEEGKGGTAHNEFLLVLSESGIFTGAFFIAMVVIVFAIGMMDYYNTHDFFTLMMLMAFSSFVVHSFFNNFLDTDKTAALFLLAAGWFASRYSLKQSAI
jgi:putative inorganic carbon (hco3(-)) transporter